MDQVRANFYELYLSDLFASDLVTVCGLLNGIERDPEDRITPERFIREAVEAAIATRRLAYSAPGTELVKGIGVTETLTEYFDRVQPKPVRRGVQ